VRVRWTRLALAHLAEADRHATQAFGVEVSTRTPARIEGAVAGLLSFPERGRNGRVSGTRELVIPGTPFVVAYRLEDGEVHVPAVLHGRRRWPPAP
jgi:toxin ParE1/3/4